MGDATIFGVPNHGVNPANTWTGGNVVSGFPLSNLGVESLSDVTLLYPTARHSWIKLAIDTNEYRVIGGVGVMNTNLWKSATRNPTTGVVSPVATWRVSAANTDFNPRLNPDAIAASSNLTGTVAAVQDDPDYPDGTWLTATTPGTATSARFTFGSLGGLSLATGAGSQTFRFCVRKTTAGTGNPVLTVELYEGGSLKATLAPSKTTNFTSVATGELVTASWDAADLADITGAALEVRVVGTGTSGTSLEFGAVESVHYFAFSGGTAHDSGGLGLYLPDTLGVLPCNLYYLLPTAIAARFVYIEFTDAGNPDGYIQVGLPIIGPRFTFGINNVIPGAEWSVEDDSVKERTVGGATRADRRKLRRGFHGTWDNLTDAQAYEQFFDKLILDRGTTRGFVFIFDPDTPTRYPLTAAYATLNGPQTIVHPYADANSYAIDMSEEVA